MKSYRILRKAAAFLGTVFLMGLLTAGTVLAEDDPLLNDEFDSCRLIILTDDTSIFTDDAPVLSSYNNVYLLQFESAEQTLEAYQYYQETADLVETDAGIRICGEETEEAEREQVMTLEENPLSLLEEAVQAEMGEADQGTEDIPHYDIALIDTGASGDHVAKAVSMIGEDPADHNGHGTRMAAFIAEENPDARILSIKALGDDGRGQISAVYAAIEYAITQKVRIISLSASAVAVTDNSILKEVIRRAAEEGILFVGSAGNDGSDAGNYIPGNIETAIIVGACDELGRRLSASNYGTTVDYYIHAGSTSEAAARLSGRLSRVTIEAILEGWNEGFLFTRDAGDTIEEEAAYYQVCADGRQLSGNDFRASLSQPFYSVQGLGDNDILYYTYINGVWTPAYCIDHGKANPNGDYYSYSETTNNILGYIMRNGYPNTTWGLGSQEAQFLTQAAVFGALGVPLYEISDGVHSPYWVWNHFWGGGWFSDGSYPGDLGHFQYAANLLDQARSSAAAADAQYVNFWMPSSGAYQRMITPARATTSLKVIKTTSAGAAVSRQLTGNAMYSANYSKAAFRVRVYDAYAGSWSAPQTYETGSDGSFTVSGLYVGNKVQAEEIRAPKGYRLPEQTMKEITLAASGNQLTFQDAPVFANGVPKVRKVTCTGETLQEDALEGVVFKMEYFDNDSCAGTPARTWYFRTGRDGTFAYSAPFLKEGSASDALYVDMAGKENLPLGSIRITETECPRGYLKYSESVQAKIVPDSGGDAGFSWITKGDGQVRLDADGSAVIGDEELLAAIDKVDSSTGRSIEGARLQLLEETEVLMEWETVGQQQLIRNLFVPDKTYTIREIKAPEDYQLAEDILFQFDGDGNIHVLSDHADVTLSPEGYPLIRMADIKMIRLPASGSSERLAVLLAGFLLFCGGAGTGACFLAKRKNPKAVKAVLAAGIGLLAFGIITIPIFAEGELVIEGNEGVEHKYTAYQLLSGIALDEEILWDVHVPEDIPGSLWDRIGVDENHRAETEIAEWIAEQVRADTDGQFAVRMAKAVLAEEGIHADGELISGETVTLPDGYYLLISEDAQPVICLTGNGMTLTIREKSDLPVLKKEIGEQETDGTIRYGKCADSGFGKTIPYRITGTLPSNYNAFDSYSYCFQDRFDTGLAILPSSVSVTIQDAKGTILKEITEEAKITAADREMSIRFPDLKTVYPSLSEGTVLVVDYEAFLEEGFAVGPDANRNEAWIEYTRSPVFDGTGKSVPDQCRLYTWEMELHKRASDSGKALPNAAFTIRDSQGWFLNQNGTRTRQKEDASVWMSDEKGRIHVKGMDSGVYTVDEVKPPEGYLQTGTFHVLIEADFPEEEKIALGAETDSSDARLLLVNAKTGKIRIGVMDQPAPETPKTGNHTKPGQYVLAGSFAGVGMLAGSAAMIRSARRKKKDQR